jgi:putative membrane protein
MIRSYKTLLPAFALSLALAACGQNTSTTDAANTSALDTTTSVSNANPVSQVLPPPAAPDFVTKVAMSDMFEIQASRLAARRGGNAQIKAFANQMIHDHTASSAALRTAIHGDANLPLPTALDDAHKHMLDDLTNASAADFDQKYIDQQTHAHQDALDLLTNYGQHGDNDALKTFASTVQPTVQHHLDMVKDLDHSGADEPSASTSTSTTH